MPSAKVKFTIHSYWHAGSGSGEGSNLDALVVKSPAGLPYLPGRTVKGLLREAVQVAEDCRQVAEGITEKLFGTTPTNPPQTTRFGTLPGSLAFESATLGNEMEEWAGEEANRLQLCGLYAQLASTKIESTGIASDKSLRKIEVAVPLQLTATVSTSEEGDEWLQALITAAPLLRSLGAHRSRGMGRATVEVTPCKP
ncbi:MAG TPA: hypothetical protein HPP94_12845 [Desulfuromonadales bacterium]|nr:hypothetical protein [Desulfuromonadales bacterium]